MIEPGNVIVEVSPDIKTLLGQFKEYLGDNDIRTVKTINLITGLQSGTDNFGTPEGFPNAGDAARQISALISMLESKRNSRLVAWSTAAFKHGVIRQHYSTSARHWRFLATDDSSPAAVDDFATRIVEELRIACAEKGIVLPQMKTKLDEQGLRK